MPPQCPVYSRAEWGGGEAEPVDPGHGEEYDEGYVHTGVALGRSSGDDTVHSELVAHPKCRRQDPT
jgi:hypothetical protein